MVIHLETLFRPKTPDPRTLRSVSVKLEREFFSCLSRVTAAGPARDTTRFFRQAT